MWLIEEYARRGRSCVWFIPPIPPINAPKAPRYRGIKERWNRGMYIISQIGIIFCQVARIRHCGQLRLAITFGSQKWQGAAPILIKILNIKRKGVKWAGNKDRICGEKEGIIAASKEAEPIVCAKKYFIAASDSWFEDVKVIRGSIDSKFNSILAQIIIQLFLERAIIVERNRVEMKRDEKGCRVIIKIDEELNFFCQN